MFLLVGALTVIDCIRTKSFDWTHAIVLLITCCVTVVAGVDGAYPDDTNRASNVTCPDRQCRGTMTFTEGREPTGLAMENLSRVLGDVQRSSRQKL